MPRNYKSEYANYHGKPEQKRKRAMRNAARRAAIKSGKASKGDGRDVHHVKPLAKGGTNAPGNTRVTSQKKNRSFNRTRGARMK